MDNWNINYFVLGNRLLFLLLLVCKFNSCPTDSGRLHTFGGISIFNVFVVKISFSALGFIPDSLY